MYSVYESRTNVTEQKYWILLNDLISYKLKYQAKKARLILQSGKYIFFCYLSLCTLFVHCKFCDFLRACEKSQKSQSQLQILQNLRKLLPAKKVRCHVNVCHSSRTKLQIF